ncbi:uncharacterized protein F4822DRAFT_392399 [Hypoxylon trugodes]|uniref:uncharacterized protein n=1 Tax=Hypoxylon trugodes TaxID=326681 RepID=UPI0021964B25|nr:uncharacterized protein F4822DRAFT_392399 [Hypoxylon trugodes]KAI1392852.1 hypothetical protein F4822DRAFT_392399 [Hypoxylon trugodes]
MGIACNDTILSQPALGRDVQLGMLYDVRTSQFFGGISLWDNDVVNANEKVGEEKVQNAEFSFSYSLEEARRNSSLDIEASLGLDLKLLHATGSAKYLNDKKSSAHEARVDVSCTVVRRTRRIPQEVLASMKYGKYLDDPRYTHFVAEVVEGGSGTLSFVQSCSSDEEARKITGELKVSIEKIPVQGSAKLEFSKKDESIFDNVRISYSGAMAENVTNLEDARRVAGEMPTKLAKQLNTFHYTLLPLTVLDSKASRLIRILDTGLVAKTAAALKAGTISGLNLKDLADQEVFQYQFPAIKRQISNLQMAFSGAETEFTKEARRLLPELRDGTMDEKAKIAELQSAVALFEQRTEFVNQFIKRKHTEASVLRTTVATLLADDFESHLGGLRSQSLIDGGAPKLLLSFGGPSIWRVKHPLQEKIEAGPGPSGYDYDTSGGDDDGENDDDDDEEEDEEWFEDQQTVASVQNSCAALRQQRLLSAPGVDVAFGVASIDKAYRPGKSKKTKTSIGDIVLQNQGKLVIVTGMLPKPPTAPKLKADGQTITVTWFEEREKLEQLVIPTTGYIIKYCRRLNPQKDGAFPKATENEPVTEINCAAADTEIVLTSLSDDCDYEVAMCVQTTVGLSEWSSPVITRTAKLPSVVSQMIDFFHERREQLTRGRTQRNLKPGDLPKYKPWELHAPNNGGKKTLFLGLSEVSRCLSTNQRFLNEIAVRIVDVAAEFNPRLRPAPIEDEKNTIVVVFAGTSGHGKSTQINAFISYLLGGEVDDPARILVIDDRGAKQSESVTQLVTCFRIRPLSPLFRGKTLLIVDTPGYGDSRGVERDAFVTAAMSEFFKMVNHVNAIIFTCRANEVRTTLLSPVSTYVFSLFAKDVRSCLRTIYTFSDAGSPLAQGALKKLRWPVENGEISVNNSAFTVELSGSEHDVVIREGWLQSVRGQFQLMRMLLNMPFIPTKNSASVTQNRIRLEQKCELAEKKILKTANDAQNLIASLGALANAVGAAPGEKIEVIEDRAVQKPVEDGNATTLCLNCNFTCHEICAYGDDDDKSRCAAMNNGRCTMCKGHCLWGQHKNARYIITTEKHSEWMVPLDLIKRWNNNNNSLEGALLDAMDRYLQLQESLRNDILELARLSEELTSSALLHDPTGLIGYMETLIQTARAQGAPSAQLIQLATAKNTLILVREVKGKGEGATRDSRILLDVIGAVRREMERRMKLSPKERAREEEKSCNMYNILREALPLEIRDKAPTPLRKGNSSSRGALYPENLQAVVKLVEVVLKDGGVVAALAASAEK